MVLTEDPSDVEEYRPVTEKHSLQDVMPGTMPADPAEHTVCSYGVRAGDGLHISGMVAHVAHAPRSAATPPASSGG